MINYNDCVFLNEENLIKYKDLSTDVITGIDRYSCNKDEHGVFFIKLADNEKEDEYKKNLIMPFINGKLLITSDLHLNHKNRNSENFKNLIINDINLKAGPSGAIMFLGDLGNKSLPDQKDYLKNFISKINCSIKILILGNHDNLSISDYYDMGFTFVTDKIETKDFIFTHCPVDPKNKINIHGHIHGDKEYWNIPAKNHIDVYIGSHDNKVYNLSNYLEFFKDGKYNGKSIKKDFN